MTVEWMRDRLEQAARLGQVVKLTGPRSISDPGVSTCCAPPAGSAACIDCDPNGDLL